MKTYDTVVFASGWAESWDENLDKLKKIVLAPNACVFVEVGTYDLQQCFLFMKEIVPNHILPYVFKLWSKQTLKKERKNVKSGPNGCILSDTSQFWCFPTGKIDFLKTSTSIHIASPKILPVLDEIADHLAHNNRLLVLFDSSPPPVTTEFDRYHVGNDTLHVSKNLTLSNARKNRMFKAYLEQTGLKILVEDKKTLTALFKNPDHECSVETAEVLNCLPPANTEDFDTMRPQVLPMLQRSINKKRKQERTSRSNVQPPAKRANAQKSGIAALCPVSDELRAFLVHECSLEVPAEGVARTQVVSALPKYIKNNGLNTGKIITPNEKLQRLLSPAHENETLTFFTMYKYINHHFLRPPKTTTDQSCKITSNDICVAHDSP